MRDPRTGEEEGRTRVVVVDDNPGIRQLLRILAAGDDEFEVVAEAGDGRAAIVAVATHQPELVLLDVEMPRMDGVAALEAILAAAPGCRVVMYSALTDQREEALRRGAHGWATKGLAWTSLREMLKEVLAGR